MSCDYLDLKLERETAEKLYSFLFRFEKELEPDLVQLMDRMEREHFSGYSIEKMKELTLGKDL